MTRLAGKVVLISGATSGIGKVCAEVFAREGASVVLTGRRTDEGEAAAARIRRDGGKAIFVQTDVTDEAAVQNAVETTIRTYGSLHVLFNNAGGSSNADGPVTEASLDEFWRVIKLDLFGTFLCSRFAIPEIARAGGGSVINNASMVGIKGELNRDAYTAAKGGVIALTRSMAAEFVREMPGGLSARIEQGGTNVSGGQRQRLSIARALIRKPGLYVFDDSFSALDLATDARLRGSSARPRSVSSCDASAPARACSTA